MPLLKYLPVCNSINNNIFNQIVLGQRRNFIFMFIDLLEKFDVSFNERSHFWRIYLRFNTDISDTMCQNWKLTTKVKR